MQNQMIDTFRFAVCMLSLIAGVIVMVRAEDSNAVRRLAACTAAVLIYFNGEIGEFLYQIAASVIEACFTAASIGFSIFLAGVIMFLPLLIVIHWLTH